METQRRVLSWVAGGLQRAWFPKQCLSTILLTIGSLLALLPWDPLLAQENVDPRSGRLMCSVTDLSVRAGAISLDFERSLQPADTSSGLLGVGWRVNWENRLIRSGKDVLAYDSAGVMRFKGEPGKQEYTGPAGERLTVDPAGRTVRSKPNGMKALYDPKGLLMQLEYPNGNKVSLIYGSDSRLSRIEGPRGSWLKLTCDARGRVTQVEGSNGTQVRYGYARDRLSEVQVNGRPAVRYAYDQAGLLGKIDDPFTGAVELTYDSRGRVTKRRWADASEEIYEYDDIAGIVRHFNAAGGITTIRRTPDGKREEITDPLGNKTVIDYNASFQPTAITGLTGLTSKMSYDALGRLTSVDGCCGQSSRIEYLGTSSLPRAVTMSDGTRQTFEYDTNEKLLAVKKGEEVLTALSHTPDGLLKSIKGFRYPERSFTYHPNGLLKTVTDAMGQTTTYEYDPRGNVIQETDPLGAVSKFNYDAHDRLIAVTDPGKGVTRYEFDQRGHCVKQIGPMGGVTQYAYDARGRLVARTDPLGRTTRYAYGKEGQLANITDAKGQTQRFEYDPGGRLIRVVNPLGGITKYEYNAVGFLTTRTDPTGRVWKYGYREDGTLERVTDPAGRLTHVQYDPKSRRRSVTDTLGRVSAYEYDDKGLVARETLPDGTVLSYSYDRSGNVTSLTAGTMQGTRFQYDDLNRTTEKAYPTGLQEFFDYDALGNLLTTRDSLGNKTTARYNQQGLMTEIRNMVGGVMKFAYDPAGRRTEETDPFGQTTRLAYNAAGELTDIKGPNGDTAKFDYDATGRLSTIRYPAGGVTRFSRDAMGNIIETTDPSGRKQVRTFDQSGRLINLVNGNGQSIALDYDLQGNLKTERFPDGNVVTYTYDPAGGLVAMDDGTFPVRYAYDAAGRKTGIEYPAIKRAIQYEYDVEGRLVRHVDSEGREFRYAYNKIQRLESIEGPEGRLIRFVYDSRDRLVSVTYPNGVQGRWAYDVLGRIAAITHTDSANKTLAGWTYAYDAVGNPVMVQDVSGKETQFKYDPAGQLTEEMGPEGKTGYTYLPGGNRGKQESKSHTVQYAYGKADELLKAGKETFKYDGEGNLVERTGPQGTMRYGYNARNQLVKVVKPDRSEVTFGYAADGSRIWRRDKSGLTWFVTDGQNLLAELDERLQAKASYLYSPGMNWPLAVWSDGEALYYHVDALDSVAALTNGQGGVAATYRTDAFGNPKATERRVKNPFLFTSQYYESELGIYYYRARYYDPGLGRFLRKDPLGGAVGDPTWLNPYAYCRNAPTRYIDPTGLDAISDADPSLFDVPGYDPRMVRRLVRMAYKNEQMNAVTNARMAIVDQAKGEVDIITGRVPTDPHHPGLLENAAQKVRSELELRDPSLKGVGGAVEREILADRASIVKAAERVDLQDLDKRNFNVGANKTLAPGEGPSPTGGPPSGDSSSGGNLPAAVPESQPPVPQPGESSLPARPWDGTGPRPENEALMRGDWKRLSQKPGAGSNLPAPQGGGGGFLSGTPGRVTEFMQQHGVKVFMVLSAAQLASCIAQGQNEAVCVAELIVANAAGGALVVVIGASGAAYLGGAMGLIGIYQGYDELKQYLRDRPQQAAAEEQKKSQARVNAASFDEWTDAERNAIQTNLGGMAARLDAACETLKGIAGRAAQHGNQAQQALGSMPGSDLIGKIQKAVENCRSAGEKRAKLDALKQRIEGYAQQVAGALEKLSAWADSCNSETTASRIRDGYATCANLTRGINQLAAQGRALAGELARSQADAAGTKAIVDGAQSVKDRIVDLADKAVSESAAYQAALGEATELKANLEAQCALFLQRIDNLRGTFQAQVDAPLERSQEATLDDLRSQVNPYTRRGCSTEGYQNQYQIGSSGAVDARLEAENRLRTLTAMGETLDDCSGITGDDLVGAIDAAEGEAAASLLANSDLPGKAKDCAQRAGPAKPTGDGTGEKPARRVEPKDDRRTVDREPGGSGGRRKPDAQDRGDGDQPSGSGVSGGDLADRYRERDAARDEEVTRRRGTQPPYPGTPEGGGFYPAGRQPHGFTPEDIMDEHLGRRRPHRDRSTGHGTGTSSGPGKPPSGGTSPGTGGPSTARCRANTDCASNQYCNKGTGKCVTCPPNQHPRRDGSPGCHSE